MRRRVMDINLQETFAPKRLTEAEAIAVIERIKDPRMRTFGLEAYREINNKFQPSNTRLELGFLAPMTLLVRNVHAPFTGFGADFITSPPTPIRAAFPAISTNPDGSLNIEIKYSLPEPVRPPSPPPRDRSPPRLVTRRSRSRSPPARGRSSSPPASPPRRSQRRAKKPEPRRSESVARQLPPRSKTPRPARVASSSSSESEEKKSTFFGFW